LDSQENSVPREQLSAGNGYPPWERRAPARPSPGIFIHCWCAAAHGDSRENNRLQAASSQQQAWERRRSPGAVPGAPARPSPGIFIHCWCAHAHGDSRENSRAWFASPAGPPSDAAPHPAAPSPHGGEGERSPSPRAERGLGGEVCTGIFIHCWCAHTHGNSRENSSRHSANLPARHGMGAADPTSHRRRPARWLTGVHPSHRDSLRPYATPQGTAVLIHCW